MASQTVLLSLAVLACLAAIVSAQKFGHDDDFGTPLLSVFRERRTTHGRMHGYAGLSTKGGSSMVFAGGYATSSTRHAPSYADPARSDEEEEDEPEAQEEEDVPTSQEDEQQDEEEEEEATPAPARSPRPSRKRPQGERKQQRPSGATAIATSYSSGKGASANSHAVAYGGEFSGGKYNHRRH